MPIVLTGDVHHAIGSSDQRHTQRTETAIAVDYAQMAARYDLKVTLFVTGRAILADGKDAKRLSTLDNVEIGGHGWDALRPRWWHRMLSFLTGSPHGPARMQRRMIQRTCATIEAHTGHPVRSWRNHAYRHDPHTPYLLSEAGVTVWSDLVGPKAANPVVHPSGVLTLPINTLPDHEHLYHGSRTPALVAKEGRGPSYTPEAWSDIVCEQVDAVVEDGGIATILAHPICMDVVDHFVTFERLCRSLSKYDSLFAGEVPQCIR